jgi:SAM-dependent methyltransferase
MKIFNNIYKYNLWGFGSGTGSLKFNNKQYIKFMNEFLKKHNDITKIVDLGCGDWQLHKHINLEKKKYLGIDIVDKIINTNKKIYGSNNISFQCINFLDNELPEADLCIIKDVLQHLSDENIHKFFNKLKKKIYKYVLITNDISKFNLNYLDIPNGMYKPIDITKSPYNYKAKNMLCYYEKIYLISYFILLLIISSLVYFKGYKLYIISLILLIIYGIGILPKKTVYLLN